MKNLVPFISILFAITGCIQSQKDSKLSFVEKFSKVSTNKPTNPFDLPQVPKESLDEDKMIKTDPKSCALGAQLKNEVLIDEHFQKAKDVFARNSCLSCHNSTQNDYEILNYTSTSEMINKSAKKEKGVLLDPFNLKNSLIITKLSNFGGSMPAISEDDLNQLKEWIRSIDYECLIEKEVQTVEKKQVTTSDSTLDFEITHFKTSKTHRSLTNIKMFIPNKANVELKVSLNKDNVITAETIESLKNLTSEEVKDKYKKSTTFIGSVKNKILTLEERTLFTSLTDELTFLTIQENKFNLDTGINTQSKIAISDLPSSKNEINKIETSISSTATFKDNVFTIEKQTRTLSKSDNTFTTLKRVYIIDDKKLAFTDSLGDYGPKSSITVVNGIRSEIQINSYLKEGKVYLEKKVIQSLEDGTPIDGEVNNSMVSGSSFTTSVIEGGKFTFTTTPLVNEKNTRPVRVCDIAELEKKVESESASPNGRWISSKNINIRLGDGFFTSSTLVKIFGEPARVRADAMNSSNDIFGGNFDHYDIVRMDSDPTKFANLTPENNPLTVKNSTPNNDSVGLLNPIRLAISVRVCEDIVKLDSLILYAIKNATGNSELTIKTIPYPFRKDFIAAHALFYPSDPISTNTISALTCVASTEESALNQWRNIFLSLCVSPDWQMP